MFKCKKWFCWTIWVLNMQTVKNAFHENKQVWLNGTNFLDTVFMQLSFEPRHDKSNKMSVRPAKTQISLGICPVWSESSLCAWRQLGSLATHSAHSEDWSDWADAQADLSLRWAHTYFVGFVMSRLIFQEEMMVTPLPWLVGKSIPLQRLAPTFRLLTHWLCKPLTEQTQELPQWR